MLLMWLCDARSRNIPVNGLLLMKRAAQLAAVLGHDDDITFSDGWLKRSKARHSVTFMQVRSECNCMSVNAIAKWQTNELPALLASYDEKDVFIADESGSFYKAKLNRTNTVSGSQCHGVREALVTDSFSDIVTFDNGMDNEELTEKEVRATMEGTKLSSDKDSEREDESTAVRLTCD
ncbi:hypothetical protein HPB51_021881 [Rhipicephalus microplus]|uniref:HTH CENPB-type domain-containing protein n=1 Tax=Rhipicephalus microplus TaxID=6941 RepID=A0A9J6EIH3_RHIMP|nr:hypothetical protein HPB51_021881 [Rhipicephalus microplus]